MSRDHCDPVSEGVKKMIAMTADRFAPGSVTSVVILPHPGVVRVAIASLRDRDVALMPREDLIDMIRMSRMTSGRWNSPVDVDRLADNDLTRLAFLVRRCCRNQLDAHRQQSGQPMLWREAI
jgi:hypothetical protein